MTNPCGRSFLSYCRVRQGEADLVVAAQHDVGIPTWRDVDDLDEVPTEEQIREVLESPQTANAVLWITPEVSSDMIRAIEVPVALDRARRDKTFFVLPVLAGGLDYGEASKAFDHRYSLEDLRKWNLRKVVGDPIDVREAAKIAGRVLRRRIELAHQMLPAEEPFRIAFYTRIKPSVLPEDVLTIDWSARFGGFQNREAASDTWHDLLLPALSRVAAAISEKASGRRIEARGFAAIPAMVALGCSFMAPLQIPLSWVQLKAGEPKQIWSLEAGRVPSDFTANSTPHDPGGRDVAVLVSVADDAEAAFAAIRPDLPPLRSILHVRKEGGLQHHVATPGQALDIAFKVIEGIRQERKKYRRIECTHLFMAVPAGLAMLIGQLSNTLGPLQTYEHIQTDVVGIYRPAARLNAGDLSAEVKP